MVIRIRNAKISDIEQIFTLEREIYSAHHWSKKSFASELKNKYSRYLVFELDSENKEILGYVGYWILKNEGHITTMVVSQYHRRKHIADILLYNLINCAYKDGIKWLTLEVRISNLSAIGLYFKYKFKQLGIRKNYYQDNNEDALILWTDDITKNEYQDFLKEYFSQLKEKFNTTDILQYGE